MATYAIGLFQANDIHEDLVEYVEQLQDTLEPFNGRFLVHGGEKTVKEGNFDSDVVLIEFPDKDSALGWYESEAYQKILPLRTAHIGGDAFVVEGVGPDYDPGTKAEFFRSLLDAENTTDK